MRKIAADIMHQVAVRAQGKAWAPRTGPSANEGTRPYFLSPFLAQRESQGRG